MNKKFSILLLAVFILPLIALFGCGNVSFYAITIFSSSGTYGSVSGNGTYEEGSVVTLTATAKQGSQVVGWIFQGATQLQNDGTYKIEDIKNEDERVTKSTLSFTSNANTQGSYTAVFEESKMMYVKLKSFYLSIFADANGNGSLESSQSLLTSNIEISQGAVDMTSIYANEGTEFFNNVSIVPENITGVLKLSTSFSQHVHVALQIANGETISPVNCRADIKFQENTSSTENNYNVAYSNGTYKITFTFNLNQQDYYLTLNYQNLG